MSVAPPPGIAPPPGMAAPPGMQQKRGRWHEEDETPDEDNSALPPHIARWPQSHVNPQSLSNPLVATGATANQKGAKLVFPPGYTFDRQLHHKDGRLREKKKDQQHKYARAQVAPSKKKFQREEGRNEYNVWYGKFLDWDKSRDDRCKAETRCSLKNDSGMTKATDKSYFCIWFARGCCTLGKDCQFLHRAPNLEDAKRIDMTHDCFGRDRHASMRDDMGGVGCFTQDCRALYVGNLGTLAGVNRFNPRDRNNAALPGYLNATEILARHFGEWGAIEECSYKPKFACAFIRYVSRLNAEFAKVAMSDQSLDNQTQFINVRWAYEDPNPKAQIRVKEENVDRMKKAVEEKGFAAQEAELAAQVPESFKNKKDFGKNPYAPEYDSFGYHLTTGEYNPLYNINAHELHKDEFAQQAGRAAVAALKRAKKYTRAQELEEELSVTKALVTGEEHPALPSAEPVVDPNYDVSAYYQYYYYARAQYEASLYANGAASTETTTNTDAATTSADSSSSSTPSAAASSTSSTSTTSTSSVDTTTSSIDPAAAAASTMNTDTAAYEAYTAWWAQQNQATVSNPGVAIYNGQQVALVHPDDTLSQSYLEHAQRAAQEADWAAGEAALFTKKRKATGGDSIKSIGPVLKGTPAEPIDEEYEEMIRRKEEKARKDAEDMHHFSRLLDQIDQRRLNG